MNKNLIKDNYILMRKILDYRICQNKVEFKITKTMELKD